jgi:hypothetical protein
MRTESFLLASAVVATGAQSSVNVARFRHHVLNYTLGAAIDTGSIVFAWEYRAADGTWKTLWSITIDSTGPSVEMPIVQPNTPLTNVRANISTHDAVDAEAEPVPFTATLECGD